MSTDCNTDNSVKSKTIIVGAGISGLYAAWRILNECPNEEVIILEKSSRTGGRLQSDQLISGPGNFLREEEGGMRFLLEGMDNLMALLLKLDLYKDIIPFPMNDLDNRRYYIRGQNFNKMKPLDKNTWASLYALNKDESGLMPQELIEQVFTKVLSDNASFSDIKTKWTAEDWQSFRINCQWKGAPLHQMTLWELLNDMGYSHECIIMLSQTLGFQNAILNKINAGIALQLLTEFSGGELFYSLKKGFATIQQKLKKVVGEKTIHLNAELESIQKDANDKAYRLIVKKLDEHGDIKEELLYADKVILALPQKAIEKIYIKSNMYNKEKYKHLWGKIQSSVPQSLLKINLFYDKAWWVSEDEFSKPLQVGPHYTDTPLGCIYPFYSILEHDVAAIEYLQRAQHSDIESEKKLAKINKEIYQRNAALTFYCDHTKINFWQSLQSRGPYFDSALQAQFKHEKPQSVFPASSASVETITSFLKKIFGFEEIPEPILTSAKIWEDIQFVTTPGLHSGYGYHQWALGCDDADTISSMVEIMPNVYTCGESFSDYQGWVEGALRSANLVLEEAYHLKTLPQQYLENEGIHVAEWMQDTYEKRARNRIRKHIDADFS